MNYLIVTKNKGVYFGVFDNLYREKHIVFMRLKKVFKVFSSWKGNWLTSDYSTMVIRSKDIAWKLQVPWENLEKEQVLQKITEIYPDLKRLDRASEKVKAVTDYV